MSGSGKSTKQKKIEENKTPSQASSKKKAPSDSVANATETNSPGPPEEVEVVGGDADDQSSLKQASTGTASGMQIGSSGTAFNKLSRREVAHENMKLIIKGVVTKDVFANVSWVLLMWK